MKKNDPLDFLVAGHIALKKTEKYLKSLGFLTPGLSHYYRHITEVICKNNKKYFFKMASRKELSVYIENEYAWCKAVSEREINVNWPFLIPKMYEKGTLDNNTWLISEYIVGENANDDHTILEEAIVPMAHFINSMMNLRLSVKLPLDDKIKDFVNKKLFIERVYSYKTKIKHNVSDLTAYLIDNIDIVKTCPCRGDLGAGSIMRDKIKKLWLIDSEYASQKKFKFYDFVYFYYRLLITENRPDLAKRFYKIFLKIHPIDDSDKNLIAWVFAYRLLGGYNESQNKPDELEKLQVLHTNFIKRSKWLQ